MMRWILFFIRVAFISNLCFLLAWILRLFNWGNGLDWLGKTLVILGYLVSLPLNILLTLTVIFQLGVGKIKFPQLPRRIFLFNVLMILGEIIYFYS